MVLRLLCPDPMGMLHGPTLLCSHVDIQDSCALFMPLWMTLPLVGFLYSIYANIFLSINTSWWGFPESLRLCPLFLESQCVPLGEDLLLCNSIG